MCLVIGLLILISWFWLIDRSCDLVAIHVRPPPKMVVKQALGLAGPKPRPRLVKWQSRFQSWTFATACKKLVDPAGKELSQLFVRGEKKINDEQSGLEWGQRWIIVLNGLSMLVITGNEHFKWWSERLADAHLGRLAMSLGDAWGLVMLPLAVTHVLLLMRRRHMFYEVDGLSDLRDALQQKIEATTLHDPSSDASSESNPSLL